MINHNQSSTAFDAYLSLQTVRSDTESALLMLPINQTNERNEVPQFRAVNLVLIS